MTKIDENIQTAQNLLSWIIERCYELEEENKKLKSDYDRLDKVASENVRTLDELEAERIELEQENKKLKEDVDYRHHRAMVAERWQENEY